MRDIGRMVSASDLKSRAGDPLKATYWLLSKTHMGPHAWPSAVEEAVQAYKDLMNRLAYQPGTMRTRGILPRPSGSAGRMRSYAEIAHLLGPAFRR